jgi:hypothetical protein
MEGWKDGSMYMRKEWGKDVRIEGLKDKRIEG